MRKIFMALAIFAASCSPMPMSDAGMGLADSGVDSGSTTIDAGVDGGSLPTIFRITRSASPARLSTGPLREVDPFSPASLDRRNERVELTLTLEQGEIDPSSVEVLLRGVPTSSTTALVEDGGCAKPCSGPAFCRCYVADLSVPQFDAFRGEMTIEVSGRTPSSADTRGSSKSTPSLIPTLRVTRWAWSRDFFSGAGALSIAEPAIDAHGRTIVGGRYMGEAIVASIDSAGQFVWSQRRHASAPIVIGEGTDAGQRIFVPQVFSGLAVLDGMDGGQISDGFEGFGLSSIQSPMSLSPAGTIDGGAQTLLGLYDLGDPHVVTAFSFRAVEFASGNVFDGVRTPGTVTAGGALTTGSWSLTTGSGQLRGDTWTTNGWGPSSQTPWHYTAHALAVHGLDVVGSTHFSLGPAFYRFTPAKTVDWQFPAIPTGGGAGFAIWGPSTLVGLYYATPNSFATTLVTLVIGSPTPIASKSMPAPFANGPAIGPGGVAYTVDTIGMLSVWALPMLNVVWPASSISTDRFDKSPLLDCARDAQGKILPGRPGRLLIASESGRLYSIITDSRGLDALSTWPMPLHDTRNTNNAMTPLGGFACP